MILEDNEPMRDKSNTLADLRKCEERSHREADEASLRNECGYKGYQPYWDWSKYLDIVNSPIFNGGELSKGGNDDPVTHSGMQLGQNAVRASPGGGCVIKGPLAKYVPSILSTLPPTVSLIHSAQSKNPPRSLMSTMDSRLGIKPNPRSDGYGDNPRCHRRDDTLQQTNPSVASLHVGGHYSIWGDPGGDVYVSPNEPAFWLHHGQLYRHWWMWVKHDAGNLKARTSMYDGGTIWMEPNSAKRKPTDIQWLDVVAPPGENGMASKEFFSTTAAPFCYVYQ
ncbi:Di-copper centre-containing protein [Setomelanomma holmii]|uniref:Di-copper centre-containing protein n=1 Tax=Setomelanomma holmii TaxID=210430 RepID=A0A9P4LNA9_9PLEO|nr:Di-copper centre-containing protein [Setomelanomma holmii]